MWPYPKVLAHRGGGILAPENTLAAMRCGLDHGFHAVEFDVMLSADGVPILMHDDRLGRTVAGVGGVADFAAEQLLRMDAGSWFGPQFAGETVPAFAEVAAFCKQNGIWMNVEIKPVPGFEVETGKVAAETVLRVFQPELAVGAPVTALPLFSSFAFEAVQAAQQAAPQVPRAFLMDRITPDWRERLQTLHAVALHTNQKHLTLELAQAVKAAGYGLFCYTVNDAVRARELLAWGVDGFCTDRIDLIGAQFAG
ncbi:MAG: glycerophosphodiester phosphodiesterase [Burkholderiaceae bacterium]|nr:glycerophosphodiester phosphodiesterase [Burkholderiaceae bacterium]